MGESALKSHVKAQRHLKYFDAQMKTMPVKDFFGKETVKDPVVPGKEKERGPVVPGQENERGTVDPRQESVKNPVVPGKETSITSHPTRPELLNYEIKWALKCVERHYSMNSCEGINYLFQDMFEDSDIAKQFSCGPTKCAYLIRFGLAPYFKGNLYKYVNELDFYTVLFDESLNHSTQSKQIDIHIRFWDVKDNSIKTRFYTSVFLGHSTADITLKALLGGL
ncbi:hypothetical protein JTE90_018194 [Oedothorax gibbosus]|uniref:Uncharacterized protein n=1 Tax=Oedothorax gibbosus TaxID=931172 RepID=A0AAV6UAK7_9ARAC|nr:hypothetical protein JTE90_018194 [Oedothorax gibbosus]